MAPMLDIQAKIEPSFPRLGVIRKGGPKGERQPGKDLDYFRLDSAPDVAAVYTALGDPQPREMRIFLPFDDLDRVFRAYHELYIAGTLLCQGDGERIVYLRNPDGQLLVRGGVALVDFANNGKTGFTRGEVVPCPGMAHGLYPRCAKCKPHGYLMAIIPEVRRFGFYEFKTTSFYDILNLTGNLRAIMAINHGKLTGVPLVVRRAPQMISTPMPDGKRARREKWLLTVEADPAWVERMVNSWQVLPATTPMPALAAPLDVVDDNGDDDEDEMVECEKAPEPSPPTPTQKPSPAAAPAPKSAAWRKSALARCNDLMVKAQELSGGKRWNPSHLGNHLAKHYSVHSLADMTDADLLAFGIALAGEVGQLEHGETLPPVEPMQEQEPDGQLEAFGA